MTRIHRFIYVIGLVYLLTIACLYLLMFFSYRKITRSSIGEFSKEAEALVTVTTNLPDRIVWDYTFWDEFVAHIKINDTDWYEENITSILSSFHMDYVCVLDPDFQILHEAFSEGHELFPDGEVKSKVLSDNNLRKQLLPEHIKELFKKHPSIKYFINTPNGYYKISGASLHSSNDPGHNQTPASGYLLVGMQLGEEYLKELSLLGGSTVAVVESGYTPPEIKRHNVSVAVDLRGNDDITASKLVFTRKSVPLRLLHNGLLIVVFIFSLFGIFIWLFTRKYLNTWVIRPLSDVNRMIAEENTEIFKDLHKVSKEYSDIAQLFKRHLDQKAELVKSIRKAEESDRLKSAFLANISHKVRTPVNGIIGFSELLKLPDNTDEQRSKYLTIIEENGKLLVKLLNDIIKKSQLDSGQVLPSYSEFNLNELLDYAYAFFLPLAQKKQIELRKEKNYDTAYMTIISDREMIYQILTSLIGNAITYTNKGSVSFGLEKQEDNLLFYVKDTGIGIPENKKESIFDVFVQANSPTYSNIEGVGLGLSISRSYAELLGGKLWVESKEGKGSDFFFLIKPVYIL
ncbi:MAG: ATP-binding protein [Bacteroidales bacterium]|nr:ATP-binding protein [Bacteroidales bacterium]